MAQRRSGPKPQPASSDIAPEHLHLWQIQAVRDLTFIAIAVLLVWAGYAMRAVTVPLLVALLLAYLFEPLVARLSQHPRLTRPMVVGGLLLAVGAFFIATLAIVVPLLIGQTMQLADDVRAGRFERVIVEVRHYVPDSYLPEFDRVAEFLAPGDIDFSLDDEDAEQEETAAPDDEPAEGADERHASAEEADASPAGADDASERPARAEDFEADIDGAVPAPVADELAALRAEIENLRSEMTSSEQTQSAPESPQSMSILEMVRRGINVAFAVIGEIIAIGLLAFLIPFYFFFFSVWYPSVVKFGSELIPPDRRERTVDLLKKMDRAVAGFVRGRIVISLIMGVMLAVGWQLVGVQYAIVLGFVIGFFSIVPYLGGVGIPAAIGLLWLGQAGENEGERMAWYMIIFWPCLVFALVQVVETYFLTPVIAGKATNLDPVTILVAVLAGGAIMGVYGMLLAIPLAACIKILFMEVLLPRIKMWSRGDAEDPLPIERD